MKLGQEGAKRVKVTTWKCGVAGKVVKAGASVGTSCGLMADV